jgi:MYXO-CTERM domain-containing protein
MRGKPYGFLHPSQGNGDFRQPILFPRLFMVPPKFISPLRCATLMAAAMMIAGGSPEARAANIFWDGNGNTAGLGGNGNWETTGSNWVTVANPTTNPLGNSGAAAFPVDASPDVAYFAGTAGTVTLNFNPSLAGLVFRNVAYTLTSAAAQTITLGTSGITLEATSGITTFNQNIGLVVGGNQTWANNSANALVVNGVVSGAGTLTLGGPGAGGVRLLNVANTFSGPLTLSSGTLQVSRLANGGLNSSLGAGTLLADSLIFRSNTTLAWVGDGAAGVDSTDRLFTVSAGNFTLNASAAAGETLQFTNTNALGKPLVADTLDRVFTLTGSSGSALTPNVFAPVIPDNGGLDGGSVYVGKTGVTKDGTGAWRLTGANTFAGPVLINQGTLAVTRLALGGFASSLGLSGAGFTGNLVIGSATSVGTLRFEGSGGGNNRTDRMFTIGQMGAVIDASGAAGTPMLLKNYGVLTMAGTGARVLTLTGTNTDYNYLGQTIPDPSGGVLSLVKDGPGTWQLDGTSTYSGGTTINAGLLRVSTGARVLGTGTVTINGGILDLGTQTVQGTNPPPANSYFMGIVTLAGGELAATAGGMMDASRIVPNSGVISAELYGNGAFVKSNAGTVVLSAYNLFTGGASLGAGKVEVANEFAFGDQGARTLTLAGGALSSASTSSYVLPNNVIITSASTTLGDAVKTGQLTFAGTTDLGASMRTLTVDSRIVFRGQISGAAGGITKVGLGVLTLSGANNFGGGAVVNAGRLRVGNNSALGTGGLALGNGAAFSSAGQTGAGVGDFTLTNALTLNGDVTLGDLTDNGSLTLNGTVALGSAVTRVATVNSQVTLGGIISGSTASLTKAGPGTLVLQGNNTFNGTLTLNAGTLRATSSAGALGAGGLALNGGVLQLANDTGLAFNRATSVNGASLIVTDRLTAGAGVTHTFGTLALGAPVLNLAVGSAVTTGATGVTFGATTLSAGATILTSNSFFAPSVTNTTTLASLAGNFALTVGGSGNLTVTGSSTATTGTLTKNGAGTLTLGSAGGATYASSGLMTITGGSVIVGAGTTFTAATRPALTFGGSGRFQFTAASAGAVQTLGALTFNSGSGVVQSQYGTSGSAGLTFASLSARAVGADALFVAAGGTSTTNRIVLTGQTANAFVGGAATSFFATAFPTTIVSSSDFAVTDAAGFVRAINWGGDAGLTNTVAGGASLMDSRANRINAASGAVTQPTSVSVSGLLFNGLSSLSLAANALVTTPSVLVSGGATATISGTVGLTAGSANDLVVRVDTTSDSLTISAPITGTTTGGLTKSGLGTLTLSGANAFRGNLYVNGGTLAIGGTAYDRAEPATGPLGAGVTVTPRQIILNGGTFQLSSGVFNPNANTNLFQVGTAGGTLSVGANAALRLDDAGQLTGGGDLTFTAGSGGVFTLSNANSGFTGNSVLSSGTLVLGHANALGSAGQVLSVANTGAALDLQGVIPQVVWLGGNGLGSGVLRSTAVGGGISGPVFLTSSVTINNTQPIVLSGALTEVGGSFSLTKTGNGVLTLSGANFYTGDTTVSNGVLRLGHTQAAGPGGEPINLSSNALGTAVQLTGGITVFNPLNTGSTNQVFGGVDFGGVLQNFSGNNTYAGQISMGVDTAIGSTSGELTLTGGIRGILTQRQLYFTGAGGIVLAGAAITTDGVPNNRFHSIQKFGAGTLTVTNAQNIALDGNVNGGAFILRQGTVRLTGAGTWRSNILLEPGSAMVVDHQDSLLTRVGRLSSASYVVDGNGLSSFNPGTSYNLHLRGGNFTLIGSTSAGDTAEFFNNVTFGRGGSVITIRSAGLLSPTRLQFHNSITNNVAQSQQAGPAGTSLLIRGTNLGVSPGFASLRWNGIITWNGQGGNPDFPNKGIMSWALVDSTENGTGASFATAENGSSYARALNQGVYAENSVNAGQPYENEYSVIAPATNFAALNNNNWLVNNARSLTGEASLSPNSLTVEPGASLAFAPGSALLLQSGGVLIRSGAPLTTFTGGVINQTSNMPALYLWTLGDLDLVTTLNGGNGNANGNIGLVKAGAGVLALKPPVAAIGGLTTQGTNTFSGQMVINDGTVRLFADNAIQPNNFLALTAGSLDLNGRTQQVLSLLSDNNVPGSAGTVTNSSVTRAALVVNHDNNARTWSGRIQGNTAFVRSGQNTLTLNSDLAFTGPAVFNAATTVLLSAGALSGAESLQIAYGTLNLDNGGTATTNTVGFNYLGDRVRDAAPVSLLAGTFNIWGRANVAAVENIGAVSAVAGFNVFNVNHGGNGAVFSQDLRMASLSRPVGSAATLIIQSNATLGGTGIGDARALATSFDGGAGLVNSIVGGWAINGSDFLTYSAARGFFALGAHSTTYSHNDTLPSGSNPTANVRLTSTSTVAAGTTVLNALSLAGASQNLQFTNATDILNLVSGGFIGTNNNNSIGLSVDSGRLTAGGASPSAPSDFYLFQRGGTLTVNARVVDNPAGGANAAVRLVLTAAGGTVNLTNTAASYTGGTVVNGGTINLLASAAGVVIPASANGLVINGATVTQGSTTNTVTGQIASTNVVTLNGASNLNLLGNNTLAGLVFNNLGGTGNPNVRTFSNNHPTRDGAAGVLTIGAQGIVATSQNVGTLSTVEGRVDFGGSLGTIQVDSINVGGMTDVSPLRPGLSLQAIVNSAGGLRKTGTGVLQLSAQSHFSSGFNVVAGGLRNGVLNAGSRFSALTIASGARYDLNNFSTTWSSLAGAGDIFNSSLAGGRPQVAPTLSVGWNALSTDSTIFSGRLQRFNDAVMFNFSKVGAGTLSMTSAQDANGSYGVISVLGGTLRYANAGSAFVATETQVSNLTVSTNGTLFLDNVAANVDSRLGLADAGILVMQGGLLRIQGNATANTLEQVDLLRVVTAGGRIELQPHASRGLDLNLGNLSVPNNSGSLVVAGIDGRESGPGIAALTINALSVPYQNGQGGGSLNGELDLPVRGDILADASRTGLGSGFLVMDSDTGAFRALAAVEQQTDLSVLQLGENFRLTGTLSFASDLRMNTLTSTVGTRSLVSSLNAGVFGAYGPGGRLLDLGLTGASAVLVPSGSTTTLGAGSLSTQGTAYFHVLGTGVLDLNASVGVGGSASFVKAGDGRLNLNRRAYFAPLSLRNGFTVEESDELTVDSTAGVAIGSLVTGPGIPGSTFVTEIISSSRVRISSGEGVTTSGPGTYLLQPIVSVNGGQLFLNTGVANTFAVAALPGPAGLSALFVNTTDSLVDLLGQDQAIGTLGSVNFLPGAGGTVTNSATGPVVRLTSAAAGNFGGTLSGNLAFTRSGSGTTLLTGPQTYVGETVVRGGTLQLRDSGSLASTAGLRVFYGAVNWDNYGLNPSGNLTPTRIQATNAVTLRGGSFVLTGGGSTDTVVTLNSVSATGGGNLVNLQPYANSGATVRLNIGNLQRTAATFPTFNLNGWTTLNSSGVNTLGSQGLSNTANLYLTQLNGVAFNAGSLVNGLIGGWAVADGNSFATYTNEFGVVSLGSGWGYSTSFSGGGDITTATNSTGALNYNDGGSRTLTTGVKAMNSLRMGPGAAQNITPVSGTSYEFGVGIVTNANQTITFETVDATNTLRGTGEALYLFVNQNNLVLRPIITGTAALVSFGGATLQLAPQRGDNNYSGGTFVNGGTLNLNASPRVSRGGLTLTTANRTTIAMGDTSGFSVGMTISNGNFPAGTRITGIAPNSSLTVDTAHTASSDQTGQTITSLQGWHAIPAAGGLFINNAAVTMSAGVIQQIAPTTAVTINGGGSLNLANYALGTQSFTNVLTQSLASLTFVNDGGANTPTLQLGNPTFVSGAPQPLSVLEFSSATPLTATNDSLSTTPQIITGNASNTQLRFAAANPVITVNSGLAETGLVISAVIGQSATMTSLSKSGTGILALAGENLFSSNFILNQGGVLVAANWVENNGSDPDAGPFGSGTLVINGGFLLGDGLGRIVRNPVTVGANFDFGGNVATNNLTLGGAVTFGNAGRSIGVLSPAVTATVSGTITSALAAGSGTALTKTGPGVLVLSGINNNFNGNGVDVAGGVLRVASVSAIPTATPIQVAATAGLDLNGFDLTLVRLTGGGFITNSYARQSILTVGGTVPFTFGGSFIDNAAYDESSSLQVTKVGAGTMTLQGESFNTGGLFVEAGAVELVAGGLTTRGGQVDISEFAVFRVNRADNFELSSVFTGPGDLRKLGTSTTRFTGNSSQFFGQVYVDAGALHLGDGVKTTGDLGSASFVVANGATLGFERPNLYSFIGGISGAGGIRQLGMGTTILNTPNTFTGATVVDNGVLIAGTSGSLQTTSSITLNATELYVGASDAVGYSELNFASTIAPALTLRGSSALFDAGRYNSTIGLLTIENGHVTSDPASAFNRVGRYVQGSLNLIGNVIVAASGEISAVYVNTDGTSRNITVNSGWTLTMSGSFTDSEKDPTAYVKLGAGRMLLTGPNEQTGGISISAGVLQVGDGGATGVLGSLTYLGDTTWSPVTNDASLILNRAGTYQMGNPISGTGTVRVSGPGTVVFAGNNLYTGVTTLAGGVAQVSSLLSAGGVGRLGAGSAPSQLVFSGGILQYAGAGETSQRGFTVADGGAGFSAIQGGAALIIGPGVPVDFDDATPATTASRPLRLLGTSMAANSFGPVGFEGESAGAAFSSLVKQQVGLWVVNREGLFNADATFTIEDGTLGFLANVLGGPSATGEIRIQDGAALRWETGNTSDVSGRLRIPAGASAAVEIADAGSTVAFGSALNVGTGGDLVKLGAGTLTMTVANPALTSEVIVASGRLVAAQAGSLGTAAVTVENSGFLTVNAITTNFVTVQGGGSLGGTGALTEALVIDSAGILSPGNGVGSLSLTNLTLTSGSVYRWQVHTATGAAGTGYDTLNLTGAIDLLGASPAGRVSLRIVSVSALGSELAGNAASFVRGPTRQFQLAFAQGGVNWNLSSTSNVADLFDIDVSGFRYDDGSLSNANLWSVSYNGSNSLILTSVPEPSTYGLGLGALGLAAAALRRRRRKA